MIVSENHPDGRKGCRHEFALFDGGEHDFDRMHHLLQSSLFRVVQIARRCIKDVYGELSAFVVTCNCVSRKTPSTKCPVFEVFCVFFIQSYQSSL